MSINAKIHSTVTRKGVFLLAWPIVVSNISVPLLGMVDTAVIGNLGQASLIGAIAIGALIFSFLYWGFGFLRMGTTGLVAQAVGADDSLEVRATLFRAIFVGLVIGLILIIFQTTLIATALEWLGGSPQVEKEAARYFEIRIWSAPATLTNLVILGYFLGHHATRTTLLLQLLLNGSNIILDIVFVSVFGWAVAGVASATLIAEYLTVFFGLYLVYRSLAHDHPAKTILWKKIIQAQALVKMLSVNRDIMIRTLCLIFAFAWFTNQGAKTGDTLLAANAILMQLVTFAAFFLDGFALAAEILVGHAIGRKHRIELRNSIIFSTQLAAFTAIAITFIYLAVGSMFIRVLTNVDSVIKACLVFLPWVIASPIISVWCYQLDGIFIGATRTSDMRNAMIISLFVFLISWWPLQLYFGNHGLWASLMLFFIARALTLAIKLPTIVPELWHAPSHN
jgi:MATE family multidrug resistance protein